MRKLSLTLILASFCLPAQADLLRIDYDLVTVLAPSTWLLGTPPPAAVHATWTVDTTTGSGIPFEFFTDPSADTCLSHFHYSGISMSDIAVTSSSMNFGSLTTSSVGSFAGTDASPNCPGGFFGSTGFATGDVALGVAVDFPGMSQAQVLSSGDVMGDLLSNMVMGHIDGHLTGAWGDLIVSSNGGGTITRVPEPETLALLSAALLGFGARRLRTKKRRETATSN